MASVAAGIVKAYKYCRYGGKKEGILGHKNRENCSVMISYSHQNHKPFAADIYNSLKGNQEREVWVDWSEDTQPNGQGWMETVCKAIETHDVFLFIVNENEIWKAENSTSTYRQEFVHALKNGKLIIPIWYGRMQKGYDSLMPPFDVLKTLSHIGFTNPKEIDKDKKQEDNFDQMSKILKEQLDKDHMHTIVHTLLLTRAIEWEQADFEKSLLLVGEDLTAADNWVKAAALGKNPKPTTLHLSFIKASAALSESMKKRQLIAVFFLFIVVIGIAWPSWGVFFFSLVFSHFFVYFSSSS